MYGVACHVLLGRLCRGFGVAAVYVTIVWGGNFCVCGCVSVIVGWSCGGRLHGGLRVRLCILLVVVCSQEEPHRGLRKGFIDVSAEGQGWGELRVPQCACPRGDWPRVTACSPGLLGK